MLTPFLGFVWSLTCLFIKAPAGRKRFSVIVYLAHAINDYYGNDMLTAAADESPWPGQRAKLEQTETHTISRNGWGNVSQTVKGAYFAEELSVAFKERIALSGQPI